MSVSDITQGLLMMLSPYLQNCGKEIAKQAGKDLYQKIKQQIQGDSEKKVVEKLELQPLSIDNMNSLKDILFIQLSNDSLFYKKITEVFNASFSDTLILSLTLRAINEINNELPRLYSSWVKASLEKKGEYQNRINDLEDQLRYLEVKFFSVVQKSAPLLG